MTDLAELPPPLPRRRRRWLLLLLVPLALVAAAWAYLYFGSDHRLNRALAETERLDPHWRLDDIQAQRADVPDAENGALTVIAVRAKSPPRWPEWEIGPPPNASDDSASALDRILRELRPNEALRPADRSAMREEMERAAPAIQEARRLVGQPRGRFPIVYSKNYISTLMPNIQDARQTARLLQYDALFRAQSGDLDGAAVACLALINNARCIGDEPNFIAQLVRMAIRAIAVGQTERLLGLGEPSPDLLVALQKAIEEEAEPPLYLLALRGERAGMDQFMQSLQDGSTSVKQMQGLLNGPGRQSSWFDQENLLYLPGTATTARAALLERMNRLIEISKLPAEEQAAPLEEFKASLRREPLLVRELMPAAEKVAVAERRTQGLSRCAAAALAAERYRRRHGRWPDGLADLKGEFLRDVPLDPFDNKPLRYRKDEQGVIIYSIGQDRKDDGGDREKLNTYKEGTDVGFRLWDVDRRRRPR
jgi:hypothetical protein